MSVSMYTPKDLAKQKGVIATFKDSQYDHETQMTLLGMDPDKRAFKLMMKSSTAFDGERDNGGDDA
jgi:hypothetical protein